MLHFIPFITVFQLMPLVIQTDGAEDFCETKGCKEVAEILDASVDESVGPCTDFYSYACGGFMKKHSGRDDFTQFEVVEEKTEAEIQVMLENIAIKLEAGEESGLKHMPEPIINVVTKMYDKCKKSLRFMQRNAWATEMAQVFQAVLGGQLPPLFTREIRPRDKKIFSQFLAKSHKLNLLYYNNEGLAAPAIFTPLVQTISHYLPVHILAFDVQVDHGYYEHPKEYKYARFKNLLKRFNNNLQRPDWQDGDPIDREIEKVANFEHDLLFLVTNEDVQAMRTDLSYGQFKDLMHQTIDLDEYIAILFPPGVKQELKNSALQPIRVFSTDYFRDMKAVFDKYAPNVWYNYVYYKLIEGSYLVRQLSEDSCIKSLAHSPMRVGLAAMYLQTYYPNRASWQSVRDMAEKIRLQLHQLLTDTKWTTPETRHTAKEKLNKMGMVIGGSGVFYHENNIKKFYTFLDIFFDDTLRYYENIRLLADWYMRSMMKRIGRGNDKICANDIWYDDYALNTEAAYQLTTNMFAVYPGMMGKPMFHKDYPTFYNFGLLGTIVGHEMTHGFDSDGRKFDKGGNRKDWSDQDTDFKFQRRAECFRAQYQKQKIEELHGGTYYINGNKTLAENMADNGGIRASFFAYQKWKSEQKSVQRPKFELESLNEFNTEQLFFISAAQQLCKVISDEDQLDRLEWDPHSPNKYRVNIPLQNFEQFSSLFKCNPGTDMNPDAKKCRIV